MVLKLGDEEYAASGPSIKKAQHAAAENALRDTKYKHPISRYVAPYFIFMQLTFLSLFVPDEQFSSVTMK